MMSEMQEFKQLPVSSIEDRRFGELCGESDYIHLTDDRTPEEHWIVKDPNPKILISNEGYGLSPQCYALSPDQHGVGVNDRFFIVERGQIRSDAKLPCRFYELIHVTATCLVVAHEIGFSCLTFDGDIRWDKGGDLIERWHIDGNRLTFETWGGKNESVQLPRDSL